MYAEKDEVLAIMVFFRENYTVDDIDDGLMFLAAADINGLLRRAGISTFPADDAADQLKAAEICFYMELSGMVRETENAFGIVKSEKIGEVEKQYENGMPMFFFAAGASDPFLQLLPHETWRMRGYKYVTQYIGAAYLAETGKITKYSAIAHDAEFDF